MQLSSNVPHLCTSPISARPPSLHISTVDKLRNSHKKWVEEILKTKNYVRESKWSQSIAVGSKSFVEGIKEKLGIRAKGRKVGASGGLYHLREAQVPYNSDFTPEKGVLRAKNAYVWDVNPKISNG